MALKHGCYTNDLSRNWIECHSYVLLYVGMRVCSCAFVPVFVCVCVFASLYVSEP